jgi:hypothetical protein
MPDERISELTTITTIDINNDPMVIVDSSEPDITKRTKKTFPAALKTALSLNNVDNTSDANKPISTAQQTALDGKQDNLTLTTTGTSGAATLIGDVLNIPQYSGGAGGATWGGITGTLSDQADLQSALDAKQNSLGFTPENVANKSTNVNTDQASDTKYPSVKAVYDWVVGLFVQKNAAITGATKTKITYDAKGLVTAGADIEAADLPSGIDATKIADGSVTNAEFQYLGSVTSDIQGQLNGKQATITGAATTIDTEDLTASRALVSDGSGKVAVSSVTSTELGYVSGVTSAVQTQLNAKIATYDGATYDVTALAAVTQAEYDAIGTKSATTLYFII